jgi:hypothetical protein
VRHGLAPIALNGGAIALRATFEGSRMGRGKIQP